MNMRQKKKMLKKKRIITQKNLLYCKQAFQKDLEELLNIGFHKSNNIALSDYLVSEEDFVFITVSRDKISRAYEKLKNVYTIEEIVKFIKGKEFHFFSSFNDLLRCYFKLISLEASENSLRTKRKK